MDIFLYMVAAIIMGGCAIVLVSAELSFASGLSKSGRYILAFFLSFGVVGFTVKTFAIGLLQQQDVMHQAVAISKQQGVHPTIENHDPQGLTYKSRGKEWRALPAMGQGQDHGEVELGKRLFFDKRLSANKQVSCASCHIISQGGDDQKRVSVGVNHLNGQRNAPTVINATYMKKFFWDGRANSLEEQVAGPLTNPVEMAIGSIEDVVSIVKNDPEYVDRFEKVYHGPVSFDALTKAIAAFERTLISNDAAYDRFIGGDDQALDDQQLHGMALFDELGCRNCHMDPVFSVAAIENKSPFMPFPVFQDAPLLARYALTQDKGRGRGNGVWRVPSLRNVEHTAPYFHNGAVDELEEAVKIMITAQLGFSIDGSAGREVNIAYNDVGVRLIRQRRNVTALEIKQIVSFLKGLSGSPLQVQDPWADK